MFRNTTTKDGDIFYVEDKEIGLRELAMNVAIPTDPGQRTLKGDMRIINFDKILYIIGWVWGGGGGIPVNQGKGTLSTSVLCKPLLLLFLMLHDHISQIT